MKQILFAMSFLLFGFAARATVDSSDEMGTAHLQIVASSKTSLTVNFKVDYPGQTRVKMFYDVKPDESVCQGKNSVYDSTAQTFSGTQSFPYIGMGGTYKYVTLCVFVTGKNADGTPYEALMRTLTDHAFVAGWD